MSIWAEAYTLPHVDDPGKKIAWLPTLGGRLGVHTDAFREEGMISLPAAYPRLDEVVYVDPDDHSNDVGSVIHVFQRGVVDDDNKPIPIGSFVANRKPSSLGSKASTSLDISGPGLTAYFLDRVSLLPWDHPTNPATEPDWIYGGDNILTNPSFDAGNIQGEVWEVWVDGASTGTFTLTRNGQTTGSLAWDASPTDVKNEVETTFTDIISVSVSGAGTVDDPWLIEVTDPGDTDMSDLMLGTNSTDGDVVVEVARHGGQPDINGWTRSVNLTQQSTTHGRYASNGFRLSTGSEPVLSSPHSLRINGLEIYTGAMQVVNVVPGHRYTFSASVHPGSASNLWFRLVIRDRFERLIGSQGGQGSIAAFNPPANEWTTVSMTLTIPEDVHQVIFRFANVGVGGNGTPGNPTPFWIDNMYMAPGAPPAFWGEIWDEILADQNVDHAGDGREALNWLVPTWTTTEDSAGVPWDKKRALTLRAYDTLGQIAEAGQRLWGYVHRIRYSKADNTYYFDIFNPGLTYDDLSATDTGTLTVGMNILDGELVTRGPEATNMVAIGSNGIWAEERDQDLIDAWGWADSIVRAVDVMEMADLEEVAANALARTVDQMVTYKAEMTDQGATIPFRDFNVFWEVGVNLGASSGVPIGNRIVQSIVCSWRPGQGPQYEVFVGSDAFASSGMAGLAEAVRRLLRKPERRMEEGLAQTPFVFGGGEGGAPTVVIAASDATEFSKSKADFICTGVDDEEIIQAALDSIVPLGGGRILFTEGRFYINTDVISAHNCTLEGMGKFATLFVVSGNGVAINLLSNSRIAHLGFRPGLIPL